MKKFIIAIEEMVVQEFEVFAENSEEAMNKAIENYKSGKFVLEPGEVQFKQMAILKPENEVTEWCEF